jgi:ferredoxin
MPIISIPQLGKQLQCEDNENLFQALRANGIHVVAACDAEGVCAKCGVTVSPGEKVSKESPLEARCKTENNVPLNLRLSCLTKVKGDIEIETTYW